jgi:hypothetical protein
MTNMGERIVVDHLVLITADAYVGNTKVCIVVFNHGARQRLLPKQTSKKKSGRDSFDYYFAFLSYF